MGEELTTLSAVVGGVGCGCCGERVVGWGGSTDLCMAASCLDTPCSGQHAWAG